MCVYAHTHTYLYMLTYIYIIHIYTHNICDISCDNSKSCGQWLDVQVETSDE